MGISASGTGFLTTEIDNFMEENLIKDNPGGETMKDWTLDTQPTWFSSVKNDLETYKTTNGKYQFQAKDSYATNCEVHEYVTPAGEVGYVVYQYEDRNGTLYKRASGKGPASQDYRLHDWIEVITPGQ